MGAFVSLRVLVAVVALVAVGVLIVVTRCGVCNRTGGYEHLSMVVGYILRGRETRLMSTVRFFC